VSLNVGYFALTGCAEGLAGVSTGEDVHGLDGVPVDLGDVAVIDYSRPVVGEDL
jgi:hypothetical protein